MKREEIGDCIQTLRFLENVFLNDHGTFKRPDNIEKIIEFLREKRWIPVSERLPEKNMPCLVSVGELNLTQIAMYSDLMGILNHRIFYQGDVGYNSFRNITEYVKAWMPLPEAYKEESEI